MKRVFAFQPCSHSIIAHTPRPLLRHHFQYPRRYTSAVRRDFASFFFRNDQWDGHQRISTEGRRNVVRAATLPGALANFRDTGVLTPKRLLSIYAQLAKTRLTVLVVLTATSGVALSPLPTTLPILLSTAIGTALCSASANTLNQLQEVPYDAQMARTRQRPLVRRAISPLHATGFAIFAGIAGPTLLWSMTNPLTAALGVANIGLYAGLYTWLKRKSILNTWAGAVVGAIPPLMGWTACGGKLLPTDEDPIHFFLPSFLAQAPVDVSMIDNPLGAFALFMLLYSWQFPHFNSLSHIVRASYAQAGYKMLSVLSPQKNALVGLRHTLLLVPICSLLFPLSGITTWSFALTSLVANAIWVKSALAFWRHCGERQAKALFQHSLWYLPVVLALMMVHKQGVNWKVWSKKNTVERASTVDVSSSSA